MDLLTILIIAVFVVWLESILFPKSAPEKSIEEELGEVIGKYLKEGINVNVNIEKKDKP